MSRLTASHRCWQALAVSLPRTRIFFVIIILFYFLAGQLLSLSFHFTVLFSITSIIQKGAVVQNHHPWVPGISVAGCRSTLHLAANLCAAPLQSCPISYRNCPENVCAHSLYYPSRHREMCLTPFDTVSHNIYTGELRKRGIDKWSISCKRKH